MKIPVSVRPATIEDAADMARLHVLTWRAAYHGMLPDDFLYKILDIADQTPKWKAIIAGTMEPGATKHIMLADIGEHGVRADTREHSLQGFVIFRPGQGEITLDARNPDYKLGLIDSLYVMPDFWGCGLGHAMMKAAFEVLREEKYTDVYLTTFEENITAHGFYERQGGICAGIGPSMEFEGKTMASRAYRWSLIAPSGP